MHHSDQPLPEKELLGATGRFPEGKLTVDDRGEIAFSVTHVPGKVVLEFGGAASWIGFTPAQAEALAQMLVNHAIAVRLDQAASAATSVQG